VNEENSSVPVEASSFSSPSSPSWSSRDRGLPWGALSALFLVCLAVAITFKAWKERGRGSPSHSSNRGPHYAIMAEFGATQNMDVDVHAGVATHGSYFIERKDPQEYVKHSVDAASKDSLQPIEIQTSEEGPGFAST